MSYPAGSTGWLSASSSRAVGEHPGRTDGAHHEGSVVARTTKTPHQPTGFAVPDTGIAGLFPGGRWRANSNGAQGFGSLAYFPSFGWAILPELPGNVTFVWSSWQICA